MQRVEGGSGVMWVKKLKGRVVVFWTPNVLAIVFAHGKKSSSTLFLFHVIVHETVAL